MADDGEELRLDDLTEIYRVEKKSGSLMSVRPDLYKAIAKLLKKQREEYDQQLSKDPDSIWLEGINARRKKAVQTQTEIIEMRMAKICKMALRGAMGAVNSFEALTLEEKEYYEKILAASKSHKSIIDHLSGKIRYISPDITEVPPIPTKVSAAEPEEPPAEEYYEPEDDIPIPEEELGEEPVAVPPAEGEIPLEVVPEMGDIEMEPEMEQDIPEDELDRMEPVKEKQTVSEPASVKEEPKEESNLVLVRVLQDINPFMGYGNIQYNLKKENVVRLPPDFANILLNNNLAIKIVPSP